MSKIIIFGTGDIAQIANLYFTNDSEHEVVAFTLDREYIKDDSFEGKPLVPFDLIEKFYSTNEYAMFIAMSYSKLNSNRQAKFEAAKRKGYELKSYVSSKCSYLSQYVCGENCFILEDNTIQPFVRIGNNVTIWSGNHIGHHSILNDHLFISSHVVISGHCTILSNSFIGVNATIGHNVIVASENIIGAGSIITKSTNIGEVHVPARSTVIEKKSRDIML
jgi:sugar O-acyltransferase (sialic acid O-acetyltransferase NeuD family)